MLRISPATGLKFETSSRNFREYTLSLLDDLKLIEKTFKETKDLSKIDVPSPYFDRPNTFFYYDFNSHFFRFNLSSVMNDTKYQRL